MQNWGDWHKSLERATIMTYASNHTKLLVADALKAIRLPANVSELARAIAIRDHLENVIGVEVPLSEVRAAIKQQEGTIWSGTP
jgi:hypothetical protein